MFINSKSSANLSSSIFTDALSFELFRNRTLMILPLHQEISLSSQRPACLNSGDVLSELELHLWILEMGREVGIPVTLWQFSVFKPLCIMALMESLVVLL